MLAYARERERERAFSDLYLHTSDLVNAIPSSIMTTVEHNFIGRGNGWSSITLQFSFRNKMKLRESAKRHDTLYQFFSFHSPSPFLPLPSNKILHGKQCTVLTWHARSFESNKSPLLTLRNVGHFWRMDSRHKNDKKKVQ